MFGRSPFPLWAAVEACQPYRLIGIYATRYIAAQRAIEFGSPAVVYAVNNETEAYTLANRVRALREGR